MTKDRVFVRTAALAGCWCLLACSASGGAEPGRYGTRPTAPDPPIMLSPAAPTEAIPADPGGAIIPPPAVPQAGSGGPPLVGDEPCASAELEVTRVVPTVWLLIDGSGSMSEGFAGFGGVARWQVLRDTLLDPTAGIVTRLQGTVSFGLMIYDGGASLPGVFVPGICPRVIVVEPKVNNLADITAAYPAFPTGASTPTHYALEDLSQRIQAAGPNPDGPTYVLLATDGKPNLCDFHDGIPANLATEQQAVNTVADLATRGIQSFTISMAGADLALQAHLDAVAVAGATGETTAFSPASQDDLAKTLTDIVGGTVGCEVQVQGMILEGRECEGVVTLNGQSLPCNEDDGFRLKAGGQVLELQGSACLQLQSGSSAVVEATFACDDLVLQ